MYSAGWDPGASWENGLEKNLHSHARLLQDCEICVAYGMFIQ